MWTIRVQFVGLSKQEGKS